MTSSSISDICVMCGKGEDLVNHLSLHCEVTVRVWGNFIGKCGIGWCCPKNIADVADSWHGGCFIRCGLIHGG